MKPGDRFLLIETSGRVGLAALARGDVLAATRCLDERRRHARDLAPAVADLLRGQNWKPAEIAAVFVSRGPGSYTGLRVGIISAKAFAYATGARLLGIDTFDVIAHQTRLGLGIGPEPISVIADAQQDRVYHQTFAGEGGGPLAVAPVEEWLAGLAAGTHVTGPGLRLHVSRLPGQVQPAAAEHWDPGVAALLALGLRRFAADASNDLWNLEPLYLRPSSAEEKWRGQSG